MQFSEFKPLEKIEYAERYILIHSIIYYEMNNNIISDKKFDKKARSLVKLIEKYPKSSKKSEYYPAFYDFDGSTGFHLIGRLSEEQQGYLRHIAAHVLRMYKSSHGGGNR